MTAQSVAQLVWQGRIPVCVKCACAVQPAFYALALRGAPLLHLAEAAAAHFGVVDVSGDSHAWFESDGVALPPLPAGVLVDVLRPSRPWTVTLHLDKQAASQLPHATFVQANDARVKALLVNTLKEACFLSCGSASPLLTTQSADLEGLANCRATAVESLPPALLSGQAAVRLYLVPLAVARWSDVVTESHAVRDAGVTLRDFLGGIIPLHATNGEAYGASVQGIPMGGLLDVPVVSLHRLLAMPDQFLHVVVSLWRTGEV